MIGQKQSGGDAQGLTGFCSAGLIQVARGHRVYRIARLAALGGGGGSLLGGGGQTRERDLSLREKTGAPEGGLLTRGLLRGS